MYLVDNIKHICQLICLLSIRRYKITFSQWLKGIMSFESTFQITHYNNVLKHDCTPISCRSSHNFESVRQAPNKYVTGHPALRLLPYTVQNESYHLSIHKNRSGETANGQSFRISKLYYYANHLWNRCIQRSRVKTVGLWLCIWQLLGRTWFEATYWKHLGSGPENKYISHFPKGNV